MFGLVEIIEMVVEIIEKYNFKNVVVDFVMVCKGVDEVLYFEMNDCLCDVFVLKVLVVMLNLFEVY